jgi:transglutaminase-like putative cysteine protease
MRYHVTHQTIFTYEEKVSQCLNEVRLTPRSTESQTVYSSDIRVMPLPSFLRHRTDYFGNDVATFGVFEQHDHLIAVAESDVEVQPLPQYVESWVPWEDAVERLAAGGDADSMLAEEFIYQSPYVPLLESLSSFAEESFSRGRPLLEAVRDLGHRIHTEFRYDPEATSIDVPLAEVMSKRHGVCQDFAHIMIGALRCKRLAARYVSGYVRSGPRFQGAQASHAWVSVFVPGAGWLSFDPTNDMMPSDTHIALAWGRDYGDVTPMKGVSLGGGGQMVDVKVYVKAADINA